MCVKWYHPNENYQNKVAEDFMKRLEAGKWVVCCVASRKLGEILEKLAIDFYGSKQDIKLYHGLASEYDIDTNKLHKEMKEEDFKDVNKSWKSLRVLIYTGTVTVGIDF